MKETKESH